MIYLLKGLFEPILGLIGQWWFDSQEPLNLDPIPATIDETEIVAVVIDDNPKTPLPPPPGHNKPLCTSCGGPNFSLKKRRCITCRAIC